MTANISPAVSSDHALANRLATSKRHARPSRSHGAADYTRTDALSRLVLSVAARPTVWRDLVAFGETERYWARLDRRPTSTSGCSPGCPARAPNSTTTVIPPQRSSSSADPHRGPVHDGDIVDRDLHQGHVQTVERGVVHDVRNTGNEPAISIHAYSPRLTSMTFYDVTADGLVPKRRSRPTNPNCDSTGDRGGASRIDARLEAARARIERIEPSAAASRQAAVTPGGHPPGAQRAGKARSPAAS